MVSRDGTQAVPYGIGKDLQFVGQRMKTDKHISQ